MKNNVLITDLGPHLMADYSIRRPIRQWSTRLMGSAFWMLVFAILFWLGAGLLQAQSNQPDSLVVKVYPDGTRVILPWSEMGKQMDMGEKFGGPPKIIPYNPAKDGIVPIGQASSKSAVGGENGNQGAGDQKIFRLLTVQAAVPCRCRDLKKVSILGYSPADRWFKTSILKG